jgi:cation:H+ antiporter
MLLAAASILVGFVVLVWSADRFVAGASAVAQIYGVPTLVVGVVIVGLGTSAPEMLVSGMAAWNGNSNIAVGNALGSNITNIGLVLGITALLYPLKVQSRIIKREMPLLWVVMILTLGLMLDGDLLPLEGLLLISGFVALLIWSMLEATSQKDDILEQEFSAELQTDLTKGKAFMWLLIGLIFLVGSSKTLVWGAVIVARQFGISDLMIGLTVMAIGTSLPELAASIVAARKKEYDIALGNVLGSNMFNLLAVMAIPGLIGPGKFNELALSRDFPVMALLTALLLLFASNWTFHKEGHVNRLEAGILLSIYIAYIVYLSSTVIHV